MRNDTEVDQEALSRAKEYVLLLEQGNNEAADEILSEISGDRESELFNQLGQLTRNFHDALNGFGQDDRLASIASGEFSDAKERLNYVIEKTDSAAHTTMDAVDSALPICDSLDKTLSSLNKNWEKFLNKEMDATEFRRLSVVMKQFFNTSHYELALLKTNLTTILIAQDYQDITGQIIKRVIALVSEVETSLVELVRLGSELALPSEKKIETSSSKKEKGDKLEGPQIPGMKSESAMSGQDDVDDLLSSLGF